MRSLSRCGKSDIRINTRQDNMCCEHIRRDLQAEREHDVNTFLIPPTNQEISRHHKCIAKAKIIIHNANPESIVDLRERFLKAL